MTSSWSPSLRFLKRGKCDLPSGEVASWSYKDLGSLFLPFKYLECELRVGELRVTGYGESVWIKKAMTKSLAEAWERYWMIRKARDAGGQSITSNGFAAGADMTMAKSRAREELIERQWVLTAWQMMSNFESIREIPLRGKLAQLAFSAEGFELRFFRICYDGHCVLAGLATSLQEGAVFDAVFGTEPVKFSKLSRSLLRAVMVGRSVKALTSLNELPQAGSPVDHLRFYRCPNNLPAFDFLKTEPSSQADLKFSLEEVQVEEVFAGGVLPAVARAWHPQWVKLSWGSLSIQGVNPWPHPIA